MPANVGSLTEETGKVLDVLNGKLSQKDIIKNFFGLRDNVVIAEDGKTILEVFNDFVDPEILNQKWVKWVDKLAELWVQKEYFDSLLGKYLKYGELIQSGNSESTRTTNSEQWMENSEKPTRGRKKKPQ